MCVQCHTPRDASGNLIESHLFQGAPVPFKSPYPNMEWAASAPSIAGLVGFTIEDEVTLLTTGRRKTGESPKPPMPPFRFNREDATAIARYLKSLTPKASP
jgi:mono/diheme cytochrome c family protein